MTASSEPTTRAQSIIRALSLPQSCRVDQRVPKKLLLENGAPTAADKRLITDAIQETQWIAVLKPNTIGVPAYRDAQREYLEISVLSLALRDSVKTARIPRLAELVHRAIPYPAFLLIEGEALSVSLAHKRWAQNETDRVVLDGEQVTISLCEDPVSGTTRTDDSEWGSTERLFMESLAIARQPQSSLYALYQGWIDSIHALWSARLTGAFKARLTVEQAAARRQALSDYENLEVEITRLRAKAAKEKQIARQVSINLEMNSLLAELKRIEQDL